MKSKGEAGVDGWSSCNVWGKMGAEGLGGIVVSLWKMYVKMVCEI